MKSSSRRARVFASFLVAAAAASCAPAFASVTTLYSFDWSGLHTPVDRLIRGADDNLYGVTFWNGDSYYGAAFKLSPEGDLTKLHAFDGSVGEEPSLFLQASDGNFYGQVGLISAGAIFRMTPAGDVTYLHIFKSDYSEGGQVRALIQGRDGNLYGVTEYGGTATSNSTLQSGTVFRLTLSGELTTLASFSYVLPMGGFPNSLIEGSDGAFYGTTGAGGSTALPGTNTGLPGSDGDGTVFRLSQSQGQWTLQVLHTFPRYQGVGRGVAELSPGVFYGTTGGAVFRLTSSGHYTELGSTNGIDPYSVPVVGPDGYAYAGTGGYYYVTEGSLLRISPAGETKAVEAVPAAELSAGPGRSYYTILPWGGDYGYGSVIRIDLDGAPTHIAPRAEILDANLHLRMKAVITTISPSAPVVGKTLNFFTPTGVLLCSAVSDATGTATCGNPVTYSRTTLNQQFIVTFAGDAENAASIGYGVLFK